MEELSKYSNKVVKFCGLIIGWPAVIISSLAIPILHIWLGKDYSPYEFIIVLMVLPLTVHLAINQLFNVQQATNKLKIPAIASILLGLMNLFLAIFFTVSLKMGILGIVLSGVIISTIRNIIFMPIYTAIITNQPKFVYYKGIISPFIASFATCAIGLSVQRIISINSFASIIYSAFVLTFFYIIITMVLLSPKERETVLNQVIKIMRKFRAIAVHA
jgi:membrane protein EpsK